MRRSLALCAALGFAVALFASPAQAAFRVIRWDGTGICQIYDFGLGDRPLFPDYRVMTGPLPSFGAALGVEHQIWRRAHCTF